MNNGLIYLNINFIKSKDGKLYGVTSNIAGPRIGELFSLDTHTSKYTSLRNFGTNVTGYNPAGDLAIDNSGIFYGTTRFGGFYGNGVIFSFNPATANYTKLVDLNNSKGIIASHNLFYANDHKLYGTTNNNDGSIFSFDPITKEYSTLMKFTDSITGLDPEAHLMQAKDGKLYGMTNSGGNNWKGVIFSFDPHSKIYKKLQDLSDSIGSNSYGDDKRFVQAVDGNLYTTTSSGGKYNGGVIFSLNPSTAVYSKLYDFDYLYGTNPFGSLLIANNGRLYGMTTTCGYNGDCIFFSYNITTHKYINLTGFSDSSALNQDRPVGCLMQASDRKFYGIWKTQRILYDIPIGENYEHGGTFSLDPISNSYTKLQSFNNISGEHPASSQFIELQKK